MKGPTMFISQQYEYLFKPENSHLLDNKNQVFFYEWNDKKDWICFDIEKAIAILIANPRPSYQIEKTTLKNISNKYDFVDLKLAKADVGIDGIICMINDRDYVTQHCILIDGHHRAMKAYQEQLNFHCQMLSKIETIDCLIATTDYKLIPDLEKYLVAVR